jgi:hypothetical protein
VNFQKSGRYCHYTFQKRRRASPRKTRKTEEIRATEGARKAISPQTWDSISNNPLGVLNTERMVDLGPHFKHLSPSHQSKAREDWLDQGFLRKWCDDLTELRVLSADAELATDLLELT